MSDGATRPTDRAGSGGSARVRCLPDHERLLVCQQIAQVRGASQREKVRVIRGRKK